jgi:hypothetical protein
MPEYRLYCLDGDGHFAQVHEIGAISDADALQQTLEMKLGVKCELWQRGRLVARLPAAATAA